MKGKGSILHQAVQNHLMDQLPKKECFLEHKIENHIADVCWLKKKIVFEIQCSPLSIDIATARSLDYKKIGFFLVWILHQKSFNGKYLSLTELFLRKKKNCFYTNITKNGVGYIYDQDEILKNNVREFRGAPRLIDLKNPLIRWGNLSFKNHAHQNFLTKSIKDGILWTKTFLAIND